MTSPPLADCPFCGFGGSNVKVRLDDQVLYVSCDACGSRGPRYDAVDVERGVEFARNSWNQRVPKKEA